MRAQRLIDRVMTGTSPHEIVEGLLREDSYARLVIDPEDRAGQEKFDAFLRAREMFPDDVIRVVGFYPATGPHGDGIVVRTTADSNLEALRAETGVRFNLEKMQ